MAGSPAAAPSKRIEDVRGLRTAQFSEDAGPHGPPCAPRRLREIKQLLHQPTVHEKGAEVVRMMAHAGRGAKASAAAGAVLRATTASRDLRRLRPGHRRRQPGSAGPTAWTQFKRWYARPARRAWRPAGRADAGCFARTLDAVAAARHARQTDKVPS